MGLVKVRLEVQMSTFNESNTIQDMLAETAGCNGWIVCDKGMLDLIEGDSMGLPLGTRLACISAW